MRHGSAADDFQVIDEPGTAGLKISWYPPVASLRERGPGLDRDLSYDEMKEIAHDDRRAARQDIEA